MPPIRGFRTDEERSEHFRRHVTEAHEFNVADAAEYEAAAIAFMTKEADGVIIEEDVRARDGTIVRFDMTTREICLVHESGHIGTYFRVKHKNAYAYFERVLER